MNQTPQVRLPQMREQIIAAVHALSDPDHQRRVWIERQYPHPGYFDDLTLNVHILYDDTAVLDNPSGAIGHTLRDASEAQTMQRLADRLNEILDALDPEADDAAYLGHQLWPGVVEAAAQAHASLTR
ncbi:SCO4402 family protein [Streptomyces roseochromogenus]|uniref:Uncharacterized protein n=1 Tax=Streptomyces roseochromogenus subsp. oscitans DS 12.976 TaxID=1352936 RepID=V6JJ70_STRRC|nr:hypothetical protein [Streptomyces roseochromogenus]EST19957.1 hypothetical protein M878_41020 [Streptomyces roseochromogenus subsp. oscitans DS 12.976]